MKLERVAGKKKSDLTLYALSTCGWCRKTKDLLNEMGVEYKYVFVDLADENDQKEIEKELRKWNPDGGFPIMVIDNKDCIVGFQPEEIKKRLK